MALLSFKQFSASRKRITINKEKLIHEVQRILLLSAGVLMVSVGFVTFQLPHNLNAGGVTGTAIIANHFVNLPVGLTYWFLNLPLLVLGFFYLGRWQFLGKTLFASTLFATLTDFFTGFLPQIYGQYPVTDNLLLSAIYTAIVCGFGGGLIFKAGGTMGGTGVIGRIIQKKTGKPLSQVYFYTDGIIIMLSALVFGWEMPLYGFLMLFLFGIASDYAMEGASRIRTISIVTDKPQELVSAIQLRLDRGASFWEVTGGYQNQNHYMVVCTVLRSQVDELKHIIAQTDEKAFVTVGVSHDAHGTGFRPLSGIR